MRRRFKARNTTLLTAFNDGIHFATINEILQSVSKVNVISLLGILPDYIH